MAKKLALIDPDLLERLLKASSGPTMTPPPEPHLRSMNTLDTSMKQVLDQPDISQDEKVKQYNQLLQRYRTYDDKRSDPVPPPIPTQVDHWEKDIIDSVPMTMQRRAKLLVNRIKASDGLMSWNERGELLRNGQPVPGTNIVDLVNDVVRRRKGFDPEGWTSFAEGLREINVPQDVVGHPDRWAWIRGLHKPMHDSTLPQPTKKRHAVPVVSTKVKRLNWVKLK